MLDSGQGLCSCHERRDGSQDFRRRLSPSPNVAAAGCKKAIPGMRDPPIGAAAKAGLTLAERRIAIDLRVWVVSVTVVFAVAGLGGRRGPKTVRP